MRQCNSPPLPTREILRAICTKCIRKESRTYTQSETKRIRWLFQRRDFVFDYDRLYGLYTFSKDKLEGVEYMPVIHSCIDHSEIDLIKICIKLGFNVNEIYDDLTPMQYALSIGKPEIASVIGRLGGV